MNIHIKQLALASASLLIALGIGANLNYANASMVYEDQYPSHFNRLIPGGRASHNFYKHGYLFHAKRVLDGPGAIYGINNDYHINKSMVERALEGKRVFKSHARKVHHHAKRNWKLINKEFYRLDNDEVVPKRLSGDWQFNKGSKFIFKLNGTHVAYGAESKGRGHDKAYSSYLKDAEFLKEHHLGNKSLVKRVGHNKYVLGFDYYDGTTYGTKQQGHPTTKIHLINHNKMYVQDYRHGKLDKNISGYAHRISAKHFNKLFPQLYEYLNR